MGARWRTTILMNLASVVERADEQVLPAVYFFVGKSLRATPAQLGTLTFARALVQAISSPLSGILGDAYDRTHIVTFGCLLWGIMTTAIGFSQSLSQAMISCAFNGLGLALVIPCVQSLVADYHPSEARGQAFGLMGLTSSFGGLVGGFFATNVGASQPLGLEGWRFSFHLMAAISLVTAALIHYYASDPRPRASLARLVSKAPPKSEDRLQREAILGHHDDTSRKPVKLDVKAAEVARKIWDVLRIRTFQIIILQGIVGSLPWQAMLFFTLWLQILGFSSFTASVLIAIFTLGCAIGGFAGGFFGDAASRWAPNTGRILVAQFSVLLSLPLSVLLLKGLPTRGAPSMEAHSKLYGFIIFFFGLMISWCGSNNSAMFADIVPEQSRSTVYAFDRSFEGGVAALASPLVGLVAEKCFGFKGSLAETAEASSAEAMQNADALASSLLACLIVPWFLCLLFYTGLFWHFPRDKRDALRRSMQHGSIDNLSLATAL
ncbi:hypothetical protein WJX74_002206 [Apatococcus lobatus]|uniref:Major facilitator superfamily (MFS) profile domain-containing protein n=1 Tax=Apatococcus lobatus TaxID=904363 RepID=A0AAW1SFU5_9CHLO